ncbi:sensor histidine kinase [Brachybacterium vulturis]|uniref:sensor histidine kinase n=1 Tax=Brachybacterium vulturis TaxID=2017484 RepID=UPI0012FDF870|nr:PAS domain-containing sensor histidine kinase [Brachybacterium vulturis]
MDALVSLTQRLGRVVSPHGGTASKQLYFAGFMVALTVMIAISRLELLTAPTYLLALGVLAVSTVLALVIRWDELRTGWAVVVPMLDIIAIALVRDHMRDTAVAVSLLVFIPSLWMTARLRLPGVWISTAAVTALFTGPVMLRAPYIDTLTVAYTLLLPFTVLQIGLLVAGGLTVLDGQNQRLAGALAEKDSLLDDAATSEQLMKSIIDSVDVGIVVVDRDGHDMLMNRTQQRIHALASSVDLADPEESQLLVRYPGTSTTIPPDQRPVRRAVLGETFSNYIVDIGPPGHHATVSTSARQILDHHGQHAGAVVVFSDVTSYIETVRSQERFVAAVSHELRTPLTSVIGYLELARDDEDLSPTTTSFLEVAHRNAEQLLLIVQDLLADQVTRSGTQQLQLRPQRLSELAQQSVNSFALRAAEAGITLETEIVETPELPLDSNRMQQAVDNLLSNAVKYTPRDGRVRVVTVVGESHLELRVVDSGIGMSAQEQTNLFTEYYRTATARDSAIEGHGIGLALTRRIVVAHGGQISVRSTQGTGSTFTIHFSLDGIDGANG